MTHPELIVGNTELRFTKLPWRSVSSAVAPESFYIVDALGAVIADGLGEVFADLIVHSVNRLPEAEKEIERLREALDRVAGECEQMAGEEELDRGERRAHKSLAAIARAALNHEVSK